MAGLIGIGQSGLAAAYAQLQTTGHNIANVNTPGYVRQEVVLESAIGRYTGAGFLGRGVNVADIRRNYDQFLAREVTHSTSLAGGDRARTEALDQLDGLLADTDNGLGVAMDELRSAIADLVNRPNDPSARSVVIRRADSLAAQFRDTNGQLEQLSVTTDQRLAETVTIVNSRLESIADLNQRIASVSSSGRMPSDLMDQRDRLIDEVAASLQLTRQAESDGSVNLFSASGHALVLGRNASRLATQPDPLDPSRSQVAIQVSGTRIALDASTLGSGELAGLLRFRDQDLASAQARVGQLAAAVAGAYNRQQALGVDAAGNPGVELFDLPAPQTVPAAGNSGTLELDIGIVDPAQLAATDYRLSFDGAAYRLESLADGTVRTLPGLPATVDGLRFEVVAGAMTIGDRITIRSGSVFASDVRLALNDGAGIATGYAAGVEPGAANAGSLGIGAFAQSAASANAGAAVTLTFTSPTTFDVAGAGTGDPVGLNYTPGEAISYNGWTLTLQGTPVAGDTIALTPTTDAGLDNRNARALVALADQPLAGGVRFNDAFASLLADVGSRTAQSQAASQTSGKLLTSAKSAFASDSGVNLDEEAAKLLQFQQAYQASARVIATANSMFDTVLSMVSR